MRVDRHERKRGEGGREDDAGSGHVRLPAAFGPNRCAASFDELGRQEARSGLQQGSRDRRMPGCAAQGARRSISAVSTP
jgi:hypothetical protein